MNYKLDAAIIRSVKNSYLRRKGLPMDIAVTFRDVYIPSPPSESEIDSRSLIADTKARLAKDIWLNIPIVSANMIDVTGAKMAVTLARLGGIGFIPQFWPLEKRLKEIERVKRADSGVIEKPFIIGPLATVQEAKDLMQNTQISGFLVVDSSSQKLVGILSSRDLLFEIDFTKRVADVMMASSIITAPSGTTLDEARTILHKHKIEKLPLVDEEYRVVGLITAKDIFKIIQFPKALRDKKGRLLVGGTVGVTKNFLQEAEMLAAAGADIILIDTARAFSTITRKAVQAVRSALGKNMPIIAGNVDNPEGTLMLIAAGADAVKVGIGPGAACTTREGTGGGTPQVTAVAECASVALKHEIPIIGDGGIREAGDLSKILVAGASVAMMGWVLAGTDESPGQLRFDRGIKYKLYRGSASVEVQLSQRDQEEDELEIRTPEGESERVRYVGSVVDVVNTYMELLRSKMSYQGTWTLEDFRKKAKFRRHTEAGYMEGKPV